MCDDLPDLVPELLARAVTAAGNPTRRKNMTVLKAVVAIVVSAAGALVTALGPGSNTLSQIDGTHWLLAVIAVLGSGGIVWFTENGPWHQYIKTVVAFLSAGIASLVTALQDNHISQSEMLVAFVAAVTATGLVFQVTNTPKSGA